MTTAKPERTGAGDRPPILLGAVDVALIAGLLLFGQRQHGIDPIAEPLASLDTIVPFLLGWGVAALLAGVYAHDVTVTPARAARATAVAWMAAANVGLILRSSPVFDGGAPWPFNLVVTGTGLLVLLSWRVGYAAYARSDSAPGSGSERDTRSS